MVAKVQNIETRDEALRRLARQAHQRGIRVVRYPITGEHFALSRSQPEIVHRVTPVSCDCLGFSYHNRCTHYAALLEQTGQLPPAPLERVSFDRATEPVVICDQCDAVMSHVNGVTFECSCGEVYDLDWRAAEELDRALSDLSLRDPDRYDWILKMLTDEGDRPLAGIDPDHQPCRADVPVALGRFDVRPNDVAAVLIWREDLQRTSDQQAA